MVGFVMCSYAVLPPHRASASKLSPQGTPLEQRISKIYSSWWGKQLLKIAQVGIPNFTEPVHEEITERIYGCQGSIDSEVCADTGTQRFANWFVIAGVRWNDDPPFRLAEGEARRTKCKVTETIRVTTQPWCWYQLFRDAQRRAVQGQLLDARSGASLLARSHYGDLQFLHSMASKDGEPAAETKRRIMMWAEFTWRVGQGDYALGTNLKDVKIAAFEEFFGHTDWRVQDLFTVGNQSLRPGIKDLAFGSLMHMVEDSFPKGHVDRDEATYGEVCPEAKEYAAPGRIKSFHSYVHQDATKHGGYDSRRGFVEEFESDHPNVVDAGQVLRGYYDRKASWDEVKPYLECVYDLEDPQVPASAGAGFEAR
jgi:hypothetical protein